MSVSKTLWYRTPLLAASILGIATGSCGGLGPEDAAEQIRTKLAKPEPVMHFVAGVEYLDRLAKKGWLTYKAQADGAELAENVALTDKGRQIGLVVSEARDGVTGRVCEVLFGEVTSLLETQEDKPRVMAAEYTTRNGNHTEYLSFLRVEKLIDAKACDAAEVERKRAHFLLESGGWRLNRPPEFPNSVGDSVSTKVDYDDDGRIKGAVTTLNIVAGPTDPDGDHVTLQWTARNSEGKEVSPERFVGSGLQATLKHLGAHPPGGTIVLTARDKWGDEATYLFFFESSSFRC